VKKKLKKRRRRRFKSGDSPENKEASFFIKQKFIFIISRDEI
jgi:hypothetical protein